MLMLVTVYVYIYLWHCPSVGVIVFYICVIIYLYGDLAIYTVAVPKSLVNVTWWVQPQRLDLNLPK